MNWELVFERKNRGEKNLKKCKYFGKSMWCEERNKVRESEKLKTKKTQKKCRMLLESSEIGP